MSTSTGDGLPQGLEASPLDLAVQELDTSTSEYYGACEGYAARPNPRNRLWLNSVTVAQAHASGKFLEALAGDALTSDHTAAAVGFLNSFDSERVDRLNGILGDDRLTPMPETEVTVEGVNKELDEQFGPDASVGQRKEYLAARIIEMHRILLFGDTNEFVTRAAGRDSARRIERYERWRSLAVEASKISAGGAGLVLGGAALAAWLKRRG